MGIVAFMVDDHHFTTLTFSNKRTPGQRCRVTVHSHRARLTEPGIFHKLLRSCISIFRAGVADTNTRIEPDTKGGAYM
jgi:hypothetical protein